MQAGGLLLIAGAVAPVFSPVVAVWLFAPGALLFGGLQLFDGNEGATLVIRRLRRQQMLGALLLLITAALMAMSAYQISPVRGGEWKITLLIAAVLEVYAIFRIEHEEKKRISKD